MEPGRYFARRMNRMRISMWEQAYEKRSRGYMQVMLGFGFGFFMALVTLFFYERLQAEQLTPTATATDSWQTGYMAALQRVATEGSTLQRRLSEQVRVLCMVMTAPKNHEAKAKQVLATWGQRCSKLIFWSSEWDEQLGAVRVVEPEADIYKNLWNKTREGLRYAYETYINDYDWFLKADDDTYVIMENLRYMLYAYPSDMPIYFGTALKQLGLSYMSGGAGYVLSKAAVRSFMTRGYHNSTLCPYAQLRFPEDYCMGICMQRLGARFVDSHEALSIDKKPKFFPLDLQSYMDYNYTKHSVPWLTELTPYEVEWGLDCCSNYSITFHYVTPSLMLMYEFLIYRTQVIGLKQYTPAVRFPKKLTKVEIKRRFPLKRNNYALVSSMLKLL